MRSIFQKFANLALLCAALLLPVLSISAATQNETQKLVANDGGSGDEFGDAVAFDGGIAVIGAMRDDDGGPDSGSAYIFERDPLTGVWSQYTKLTAGDASAYDYFGVSVAIDGNTALIGAFYADGYVGSAYVFVQDPTTGLWSQQAKLTAGDRSYGDHFGRAVAIENDTILVGAWNADRKGAVYVFARNPASGVWTEQAKFSASDGSTGDRFGVRLTFEGRTALIGAWDDDDRGTSSGSAYVFTHEPNDPANWTERAKLTASDGVAYDYFGASVAIAEETLLIGANGDDDKGSSSGSVYVFAVDSTTGTWTEQSKFTASDGASGDIFGTSMAATDDQAVISAYRDDGGRGAAYLFDRDPVTGIWTERTKLLASDGQAGDRFGFEVAYDGTMALIGADWNDDNGTNSGSAYVYRLDREGPITSDVVASPNPVPVDLPVTVTATIDDSSHGGSPIASASYTIDDGVATDMGASDGTFDAVSENVYTEIGALPVGVYDICVSGTDAAGNTGSEGCAFLAVYDPAAGFVTGGGWINSPLGAYMADPLSTGKANFGFVSKYKKGRSTPDGSTQFHYQAGDLSFHSDTYDWLVVAGARAQFKGVGTINGIGNFGFMLTAIDGEQTASMDVDLFRIKIWDIENGDALVYDNQLHAADSDDPTTMLGGGSIVIHNPKVKK